MEMECESRAAKSKVFTADSKQSQVGIRVAPESCYLYGAPPKPSHVAQRGGGGAAHRHAAAVCLRGMLRGERMLAVCAPCRGPVGGRGVAHRDFCEAGVFQQTPADFLFPGVFQQTQVSPESSRVLQSYINKISLQEP